MSFDSVCDDEEIHEPPLFGNILDTYGFYTDLDEEEFVEYLIDKQIEYNQDEENPTLNLIFNDYIVRNIEKILRVISEPEGHIIMSGESGKCRQSIIRLAAFIYNMNIMILGERDVTEEAIWKESMRSLIRLAGIENKPVLLYVALGEKDCSQFLRTLSTILGFGISVNLFDKHEIASIEKRKDPGVESQKLSYYTMSVNVMKNLHVVITLDLAVDKVVEYVKNFNFLLSKMIINHIKVIKEKDFEEMVSLFLQESLNQDEIQLPENLDAILSTIYVSANKAMSNLQKHLYLDSSAFHTYLNTFIKLMKEKLDLRNQVQEKYKLIFQNLENLKNYISDLNRQDSLAKRELGEAQKIHDDLQIQKIQLKRDYEDVQKKLADEQKKAQEEKQSISQLDVSLKLEMEELWSPVEKTKHQLQEVVPADISSILNVEPEEEREDVFIRAVTLLFTDNDDITMENVTKCINEMCQVTNTSIPDAKLASFIDFLAKNKPKQETLLNVDENFIIEVIKHWCIAIEAFCKGKKSSNQKKQKSEQLKKRLDARMEAIDQIKHEAISLDSDLEVLEENSNTQMNFIESSMKKLEMIDSKIERAEKVKRFLEQNIQEYQINFANFEDDKKKIVGNSILASAAMTLYSPFTSPERKVLMDLWKGLLTENEVLFHADLDFISFVHGKETKAKFINRNLAISQIQIENHFILQSLKEENVIVCIDPDDLAMPILTIFEDKDETNVSVAHIDDKGLRKNMINTLARGQSMIVRNAEDRYENLVLPMTRKVFKKEKDTIYIKAFGKLCHYNPGFKIRILVSNQNCIRVTSNLIVLNFQNEVSDYEEIFFTMISVKKASTIHNQMKEMFSLSESAELTQRQSKKTILKILSEPYEDLLKNEKILEEIYDIQEKFRVTGKKLESYRNNYTAALENLSAYTPLAKFCASVFLEIRYLRRVSSAYGLSLHSFQKLVKIREEEEDEENDNESELSGKHGDLQLSEDEHGILHNVFRKLEMMMTQTHFAITVFKLAVTIALQKGFLTTTEVDHFINFAKEVQDQETEEDRAKCLDNILTEAECNVVNVIVQTTKRENFYEELQNIAELNVLKKFAVGVVYLDAKEQDFIKEMCLNLLAIKTPGDFIIIENIFLV